MRSLGPLLMVALALLAGVAEAKASGELANDAPVTLSGAGSLVGDGVAVYHYGFERGSLSGKIYHARVFDSSVTHVAPDQDYRCFSEFEGRTSQDVKATVNTTGRPQDLAVLTLLEGGAVRALAPEGLTLSTSKDAAQSFALLGPSPYHYQFQQLPPDEEVEDVYAPVLPNGTFVAVPTRQLDTGDRLTLELHWGTIAWDQHERVQEFKAGVLNETKELQPLGPLPGQPPVVCKLQVTHVILFDLDRAIISILQEGWDRAQAYWDGEALEPAFQAQEPTPPRGHWDRRQPSRFPVALERLHLPATTVSTESFQVTVAGRALFEHALGTVIVHEEIMQAKDAATQVDGTFTVTPTFEADEGRSMKVQIGGDVTNFGAVATSGKEKGLAQYAPYALGAFGGLALFGTAYFTWPHFKYAATQLALFPLYARLKKEDILENPLRDDILAAVDRSPGISASELGRRLSCGWGTLVYHLTVLERMHLIASAREGRHKRFFVQGRINYSDKSAASLIANPAAKNILDAVAQSPGIIQRDLSRHLGLSPGTVAWHVERLEGAGLIVKEEEGRVVRYYPSSKLIELTRQMAA